MPFTPFHLGPASVLALALLRYAYLPALLLGSIAPDIQPFIIMLLNTPGTLHGPITHSFIGSTILLALPLTAAVFLSRKPLETITTPLKLNQKPTVTTMLAGSLIGVYSHILLDATLYTDIQPFYPNTQNPLLNQDPSTYSIIYTASGAAFIIALAMYAIHLWKTTQHQENPEIHMTQTPPKNLPKT